MMTNKLLKFLLVSAGLLGLKIGAQPVIYDLQTAKVVHLLGPVNTTSGLFFQMELARIAMLPGPLLVIIESGGGISDIGDEMIAAIEAQKANHVPVICYVPNFAHSMAFNLLTHCDVRLAGPDAFFVVHKLALGSMDCRIQAASRCTARNLRIAARELDKEDSPYRIANARAMHLSLKTYDYYANHETEWSAAMLYRLGYLTALVQ